MNFWKTVEVDCWSRDFDYKNYCHRHSQMREKGLVDSNPLSEAAYRQLRALLEEEFERDCTEDEGYGDGTL